MSKDSVGRVLLVAFTLCAVCAIIVSSTAVGLHDLQEENKALDLKRNVLLAAGAIKPGESVDKQKIEEIFAGFTPKLVELGTGRVLEASPEELASFDLKRELKDPSAIVRIPPEKDIANIKIRAKRALIYERQDGSVILPIYGLGLWSTMYGYLAVAPDRNTLQGLVYYEQGETPGLGGEVDNPIWRAQFPGKKIFDEHGKYQLEVLKGAGNRLDAYKADGLSGATITTRGVNNMLEYWLGPDCFGPFLQKS